MGNTHVYEDPSGPDQPVLCRRLRVWPNTAASYIDEGGRVRKRIKKRSARRMAGLHSRSPRGYIDWTTFEANQKRLAQNTRPRPHQRGGAVREGDRVPAGYRRLWRLRTAPEGALQRPSLHTRVSLRRQDHRQRPRRVLPERRRLQIDAAVAAAFLAALAPAGLEASLQAAEQLEADHETTVEQFRRDVERARYGAQRAERRYRAVDPDNRLVARGLEAEWENALRELKAAEAELARA